MPPSTTNFGFRIGNDVKAAVETAAKAGDRSVSRQVERILREWCVREGLLPVAEPGAAKSPARKAPARKAPKRGK